MESTVIELRSREGESSLARSMKHLSRSLFAINYMSKSVGVLKAKHAFLEMLSGRKGRLPTSDDLSKEGGRVWDKIKDSLDGEPLNLSIAGIDFSGLKVDDVGGIVEEKAVEKAPGPLSSIEGKKTVTVYWKPINNISGSSIWESLPKVTIDREQFENLFQNKKFENEQNSTSSEKPKELNILEAKRSNAINFAIRRLPPLGGLEDTILQMDCTVMNREGVEKLQSLIPSEEEIEKIKDALAENPDIPLGKAEKFLFVLGNIPFLEARLNLWMFKIDFTAMERNICEPLSWLKQGMDILSTNPTFLNIINVTLQLGNILNNTTIPGFELDSLNKLSSVKEFGSNKSFLHHIVTEVMKIKPDSSDLYSEIEPLIKVSKVDFDELETNLGRLEDECKRSLGSIKLAAKFDLETEKLVSEFLSHAAERIMAMKRIHQLLMTKYSVFLDWLGLSKQQRGDYKPTNLARIVSQFAIEYRATKLKVVADQDKEKNGIGEENPGTKNWPTSEFKLPGV